MLEDSSRVDDDSIDYHYSSDSASDTTSDPDEDHHQPPPMIYRSKNQFGSSVDESDDKDTIPELQDRPATDESEEEDNRQKQSKPSVFIENMPQLVTRSTNMLKDSSSDDDDENPRLFPRQRRAAPHDESVDSSSRSNGDDDDHPGLLPRLRRVAPRSRGRKHKGKPSFGEGVYSIRYAYHGVYLIWGV